MMTSRVELQAVRALQGFRIMEVLAHILDPTADA